jgi:hypothetical protein
LIGITKEENLPVNLLLAKDALRLLQSKIDINMKDVEK